MQRRFLRHNEELHYEYAYIEAIPVYAAAEDKTPLKFIINMYLNQMGATIESYVRDKVENTHVQYQQIDVGSGVYYKFNECIYDASINIMIIKSLIKYCDSDYEQLGYVYARFNIPKILQKHLNQNIDFEINVKEMPQSQASKQWLSQLKLDKNNKSISNVSYIQCQESEPTISVQPPQKDLTFVDNIEWHGAEFVKTDFQVAPYAEYNVLELWTDNTPAHI